MFNYVLCIALLTTGSSVFADYGLPKINRYIIENSNGSWSRVEEIDNSNEVTERYCPGLSKKETTIYNSDGSWSKIKS